MQRTGYSTFALCQTNEYMLIWKEETFWLNTHQKVKKVEISIRLETIYAYMGVLELNLDAPSRSRDYQEL